MIAIWTEKEIYTQGETVVVNYAIDVDGYVEITDPAGTCIETIRVESTEGASFNWTISSSAVLGRYILKVKETRGIGSSSTPIEVVSGGAPPVTGFTDTGKVTPETIEVAPGTYDILFKLTGYEDKTVTGVVVSEGTTKTVSVTLTSKGVAPAKASITFKSVPSGASIWLKEI